LENGVPARLSPAEGRKFALTVGTAFLVLGGIVLWRQHMLAANILFGLGGTLWVLGLVVPGHLSGLNRAWMGLALLISKVTTPIFMGVVYFLVITPISLLMRLFGKAPMRPRFGATFWVPREPELRRSDLSRQF
jgi:hypothetical protein